MTTEARRRVVIALVGVGAVIVGGLYYTQRMLSTRVRTVEGTIVQFDPAARYAVIEIRHPKTGQLILIRGDVPAECDIRIDGRAATLADLQLGERVRVQGTITVDGRVTADWVRVMRATEPAGPTSQPASPAEPP